MFRPDHSGENASSLEGSGTASASLFANAATSTQGRQADGSQQPGPSRNSRASSSNSRSMETDGVRLVDVGPDVVPTLTEELLGRLQHHGITRLTDSEPSVAPPLADGVLDYVPTDEVPTDEKTGAALLREPYYYACDYCEVRLSPTATCAATARMLQDAHHHASSAQHRAMMSIVGDAPMTRLRDAVCFDPPENYGRVYINGYPALLHVGVGGGETFRTLPTERLDEVRLRPGQEILSRSLREAFWYYPVESTCVRTAQHPVALMREPEGRDTWDRQIRVEHIEMDDYVAQSPFCEKYIPRHPCVVALQKARFRRGAAPRVVHAANPIAIPARRQRALRAARTSVRLENSYRVVLQSDQQLRRYGAQENQTEEVPSLTVEMIRQLPVLPRFHNF